MYRLQFSKHFIRRYKRHTKRNRAVKEQVDAVLRQLERDPFAPNLKTHKVLDSQGLPAFSSRITGDLRIIWDFNAMTKEHRVLDILDLGGHSGAAKVYKR